MSTILDLDVPRTLDVLVSELIANPPGIPVEAWVFDDAPSRQAAEEKLAAVGITARIRSSYKPLVYFFLEELHIASLAKVEIGYPVHSAADPQRFLIEAYPLAALVGDAKIAFHANTLDLTYDVTLTTKAGEMKTYTVFAPNVVEDDHVGRPVLRCCGWHRGERLKTDFETMFLAAVDAVKQQTWGRKQPYFDRLRIAVDLPARDLDLDFCSESISLREAMHEDLFFSLRECLDAEMGAMAGQGGARPGQVVPDISGTDGNPRIVMTVEDFGEHEETAGEDIDIATATRPLKIGQIRRELAKIEGEPIKAISREGREVLGRYHKGPGPAVLISSGQHANETSGPVGALRAAQMLAADPSQHFAIVPVENVDGYELHQRLIVENPFHMHHAARYTAFGDDLSFTVPPPIYEREARGKALELSSAKLHLNLHGYPSHEWTRPMSGYLPRGFELWTIPKGFFLIVCTHPGWEAIGETILEEVTKRLAEDKSLVEFNARQIDCVRLHMPNAPFEVRYGIPVLKQVGSLYQAPVTIITEATDETVYEQVFVDCHEAQTRTVLYAVEVYRRLAANSDFPSV
ncbi:M14 family zinc carboxypeptidase [Rhizobium sp. WYJ-E13]|uniref:M14 family zinc carboxypeptidase n=1 Tax=Rhizobium sp. WYJ-E13 TaxID=2849093 RepID=UPI001C1ECE5A|nr:M14 family zinc carboxypeptidase [Rhizobium sp. WYJ-E13]QWW70415.1 peptidase M14 [Rhizobium sp. WYJ-E13]